MPLLQDVGDEKSAGEGDKDTLKDIATVEEYGKKEQAGECANPTVSENRGNRFFLLIHTYQVHNPYEPQSPGGKEVAATLSPGDQRKYWQLLGSIGRPKVRRRLRALYLGEIRDLDSLFAGFEARIGATEKSDDTLLVVTSDHGERFSEDGVGHGGLHNDVLHVPPQRPLSGKADIRHSDSGLPQGHQRTPSSSRVTAGIKCNRNQYLGLRGGVMPACSVFSHISSISTRR